MTPATFADVVAVPTVREHLAARGDRRLAYLACIATYSLVEYVARAEGGERSSARNKVGETIRGVCAPAYEVVQGISNGTKHAGSNQGKFGFVQGAEREVPVLAYDVGEIGYGEGRLDVPGLDVEHNGDRLFIDFGVQALLRTIVLSYPQHFGAVDLSFLDPQFRPAAP